MRRSLGIILITATLVLGIASCSKINDMAFSEENVLSYRFADKKEAQELYLDHKEYYDGFSLYDLQYKNQKIDGTVDELKSFGKEQMLDFTEEEKTALEESFQKISNVVEERGYHLPSIDQIVLIKSTQKEENESGAYTHGTEIYLGEYVMQLLLSEDPDKKAKGQYYMAHEIFHCLTRCNSDFREQMYNIIHFTVQKEDFPIPECVNDIRISNPDVEHHNSYATFKIDDKEIDCFTVLIATKPFEKEGDSFFSCMTTALVPIDGSDVYYTPEDASNFWDVFGENTAYVIDPEECMADNFGYTMSYGEDRDYKNPEIIEAIDEYLKK